MFDFENPKRFDAFKTFVMAIKTRCKKGLYKFKKNSDMLVSNFCKPNKCSGGSTVYLCFMLCFRINMFIKYIVFLLKKNISYL